MIRKAVGVIGALASAGRSACVLSVVYHDAVSSLGRTGERPG